MDNPIRCYNGGQPYPLLRFRGYKSRFVAADDTINTFVAVAYLTNHRYRWNSVTAADVTNDRYNMY